MTVELSTAITLAGIIFTAGTLYAKLHSIEERLNKQDDEKHGERIAVIESKIGVYHDA